VRSAAQCCAGVAGADRAAVVRGASIWSESGGSNGKRDCHRRDPQHVDDPLVFRAAVGFNFQAHASGTALHETLLAMIEQGTVRPVIGRHVDLEELPAALDAMERRETIGRTVVRVA
jgi:NADPH:quinone reductase-like Zn-dependent oxidoreductase